MRKLPRYTRNMEEEMWQKSRMNAIKVNRDQMNPVSLRSYFVPEYYSNTTATCNTCGNKFSFTAKQKQYMYEVLKLSINVVRKNCTKCNEMKRSIKRELDEIEKLVFPKGHKQLMTHGDAKRWLHLYTEYSKYLSRTDYSKINRIKSFIEGIA